MILLWVARFLNPRIITVWIEELENILKVGEGEKNLDNSMDINYHAQLIDEAERFMTKKTSLH